MELQPMRAEIVACYVVCNEVEHLADSIRSLKAYVDRFVIVDSVFQSNSVLDEDGYPSTHSTDGTHWVAEEACNAWPTKSLTYIESRERLIEYQARNMYLEQVLSPDWVFVVDGDEVLYGDYGATLAILESIRSRELLGPLDVPVFTTALNANKGAIDVTPEEFTYNPHISTVGYMPRLFPAHPDVRYVPPATGYSTPVLTIKGGIGKGPDRQLHGTKRFPTDNLFLINHHVRQSLESYKNDYLWETRG